MFFELASIPVFLNLPTWDIWQICFPEITTTISLIPYVLLQCDLPLLQQEVEFNSLPTLSGLCDFTDKTSQVLVLGVLLIWPVSFHFLPLGSQSPRKKCNLPWNNEFVRNSSHMERHVKLRHHKTRGLTMERDSERETKEYWGHRNVNGEAILEGPPPVTATLDDTKRAQFSPF